MRRKETVTVKKYIRSERPNLFEPNDYISMVVTLDGTVSPEEIEQSVRKAYANNEAARSKIVLEPDGNAYYEPLDKSGCKIFYGFQSWQEILKESERQPFDLKNGELIRTYIIRENQGVVLFFMAHHLAGDGMAMLYFIEDIMQALDGKELIYKPLLPIDRVYLRKRAKLPILVNLLIQKANLSWRKKGTVFTWEDYEVIHHNYWKNNSSELIIHSHKVDELKAACSKGITLNSYLTAILLQNFPECRVIGIPVSIREENCSMSNQTSGVAVKYSYNHKISLTENAVQFQKRLKRQLENKTVTYFVLLLMEQLAPTLIDGVLMYAHSCYQNSLAQRMSEILGYTGKKGRDLGVTNLMKIDIPKTYQNFQITKFVFVPPKVSYTKQVVGIATFGDMLHIVHHNMKEI